MIYPTIAFNYLTSGTGTIFLLGLIAATFSGADASLTALTTTTCVDFLGFHERSDDQSAPGFAGVGVHLIYAGLTFVVIMLLHTWTSGQATIQRLLWLVGLTYGPLLGLFAFGLLTRRRLREPFVPLVCLISPVAAYALESHEFFCGTKLGTLLILANAALTWTGLLVISDADSTRQNKRVRAEHKNIR